MQWFFPSCGLMFLQPLKLLTFGFCLFLCLFILFDDLEGLIVVRWTQLTGFIFGIFWGASAQLLIPGLCALILGDWYWAPTLFSGSRRLGIHCACRVVGVLPDRWSLHSNGWCQPKHFTVWWHRIRACSHVPAAVAAQWVHAHQPGRLLVGTGVPVSIPAFTTVAVAAWFGWGVPAGNCAALVLVAVIAQGRVAGRSRSVCALCVL